MQIAPTYSRPFAAKPTIINLTSACVAQYKMNDNAATTTVVDSQGFSNGTAQQNTSALYTAGKVGGALTFNGTSDYVDTGNNFNTVFQSDFSISIWIKPTDGQPTDDTDFFGFSSAESPTSVVYLIVPPTGVIAFTYRADMHGKVIHAGTAFQDGQESWHLVTVLAEQVAINNIFLSMYLDGDLSGSGTLTYNMSTFSNSDTVVIGKYLDGWFAGSIDNVMIFNKALSTDEIDFLWNGGNGTEYLYGVI